MEFSNTSELFSSNTSRNHNTDKFTVQLPLYSLLLFIAVTFFSFLLNLRVVCIVLTMPAQKRKSNILILHLSLVNILLNYFVVALFLSRSNIWLLETSYGFCVGHSYIRNALIALLPVNVSAIAFEKIIVLRKNYIGEKLDIKRTIAFMWAVVLIGSLPNLLSTRYVSADLPGTEPECRLQPLWASPRLTFVFELFRLIVFNFVPTFYILYATVQIRSKLSKYLFTTTDRNSTTRLRNKVRKVRFLVLNGVVFIVLWLPAAVLLFLYKINVRSSESGESSTNHAKSGFHFMFMVYLGYIYIMLNALIHLHLSEDLTDLKWNSMRYPRSLTENTTEIQNNIAENTIACTSRVSTFEHSMENNSESEIHEIQDISVPVQLAVEPDEEAEEFV